MIVLDIGMPLLNGLEAGRQIKQVLPATKLGVPDDERRLRSRRRGVPCGGIRVSSQAVSNVELLTAIREVTHGRSYVTPLVTAGLMGSFMQPQERKPQHQLTPRQREVLQLLAEGHSMKQVADMLNVTPRTVQFHKYRMMQQLGIRTSAELIQFAVRQHIV